MGEPTPLLVRALARKTLIEFALWISNVWEADNSDDRESAETAVDAFLSGENRE